MAGARAPKALRPEADAERLERRLALRRFMGAGTIAWTAFVVTDVIAARVHGTALEYLVAIRLAGTGVGLTIFLLTSLPRLPAWALHVLEGLMTPLAGPVPKG